MALITCPECSTEISDTALKCTKCGVQLRKPQRSGFGKLVKWGFVGFNILMLLWMIGGINGATEGMEAMSQAEQTGVAIGTGIGAMLIVGIWLAGDIILGMFVMFTRPKT